MPDRNRFPTTADYIQEHFVGVSSRTMFEQLEKTHGRKLPADFAEKLRQRLNSAFERELEPIAGVADLLPRIGVKVCVASSSQPERLRHTLGLTGLWPHFDPHVFSATMVANGKPAPDLFLYAADRMRTPPRGCVVVEDSQAGVAAGVAAGMRVLGFVGGSHCTDGHAGRLRAAGAHAVSTTCTNCRSCSQHEDHDHRRRDHGAFVGLGAGARRPRRVGLRPERRADPLGSSVDQHRLIRHPYGAGPRLHADDRPGL